MHGLIELYKQMAAGAHPELLNPELAQRNAPPQQQAESTETRPFSRCGGEMRAF